MKRALLTIPFLALVLAGALYARHAWASHKFLCKFSSTNPTAANSNGTAACNPMKSGFTGAVRCDGTTYIAPTSSATGAATSDDMKLGADVLFPIRLNYPSEKYITILAASGTTTCYFYRRSP